MLEIHICVSSERCRCRCPCPCEPNLVLVKPAADLLTLKRTDCGGNVCSCSGACCTLPYDFVSLCISFHALLTYIYLSLFSLSIGKLFNYYFFLNLAFCVLPWSFFCWDSVPDRNTLRILTEVLLFNYGIQKNLSSNIYLFLIHKIKNKQVKASQTQVRSLMLILTLKLPKITWDH